MLSDMQLIEGTAISSHLCSNSKAFSPGTDLILVIRRNRKLFQREILVKWD